MAPEHPDIVRKISARMETLLAGFPPDVRKAWSETKARQNDETRIGTVSRAPGARVADPQRK